MKKLSLAVLCAAFVAAPALAQDSPTLKKIKDSGTITITDGNNNKITLDSDGITLERGSSKISLSDSQVNINDGALEVS